MTRSPTLSSGLTPNKPRLPVLISQERLMGAGIHALMKRKRFMSTGAPMSISPWSFGRGVEGLTKYRHDEPFFGTTKKGNGHPVFILFELSTIYATLLLARGLHRIGASALILNQNLAR